MYRLLFLFSFASLLLLPSCRKNIDITDVDIQKPGPDVITFGVGDVFGKVVGESGDPISFATVRIGDETTFTDEFGFFYMEEALLLENQGLISVNRGGYFPGSRTIVPLNDQVNYIQITLLEQNIQSEFFAGEGGGITLPNNGSISFEGESIIDSFGNNYTSTVFLAASSIDATSTNFKDRSPGYLRGLDLEANYKALTSFGTFIIEAETPQGLSLYLKPDYEASIFISVPSFLANIAPATVPLWYFDETEGIWMEDGVATLDGDVYVGKISKLGYWNLALGQEEALISGQLVSESGLPIPGINIVIKSNGAYASSHGATGEDGFFSGFVPQGEIFFLEIYGLCGELVFEQEIGPYNSDTDLGQVLIPDFLVAQVFGNAQNCNELPIYPGYVLRAANSCKGYLLAEDGSFNFAFPYCSDNDFELTLVDFVNNETSETFSFGFEPVIDAGLLSTCDSLPESPPYISMLVNNKLYFWKNDTIVDVQGSIDLAKQIPGNLVGLNDPSTQLLGNYFNTLSGEYLSFELVFPAQDVGVSISEAYFALSSSDPNSGPYLFNEIYQFSELNITEYGPPGGVVRGTFSTIIPEGAEVPNELIITGEFAVFREF